NRSIPIASSYCLRTMTIAIDNCLMSAKPVFSCVAFCLLKKIIYCIQKFLSMNKSICKMGAISLDTDLGIQIPDAPLRPLRVRRRARAPVFSSWDRQEY
ncbi:MAG: hypothetical protein O7I42_13070, partial [Alphaproteobacteria bacterium]|nr:hypothetical protein [Alphaproteobacteria bacterium]